MGKNLTLLERRFFARSIWPKMLEIWTRKYARARSSFARNFWALEKFLLELARLENWSSKILLETRSARKCLCSFCSNSKIFRSVSTLLYIHKTYQHNTLLKKWRTKWQNVYNLKFLERLVKLIPFFIHNCINYLNSQIFHTLESLRSKNTVHT